MSKTVFTYGQRGGYLFECPSQRLCGRLPQAVLDIYGEGKVADTYCLALGKDESFVLTYKGKDGLQHLQCASIPPALREWLYATDSNNVLVRELDDLRVSLGPNNNSFFAHDGKSYKWSNLPSGLNAAIQQRRGSSGGWADAPRLVCLGADESYIMATEGGGGSWKLDNYRSLRECIDIIKDRDEQLSLIQNLALNPYRNDNWVLQSPNGLTLFNNNVPHTQEGATQITDAIKADAERETEAKLLEQAQLQATIRQIEALNQAANLRQIQQQAALLQLQQQMQMRNTINAMNFNLMMNAFSSLNFSF